MRAIVRSGLLILLPVSLAMAHDIPNARVDRSIQATLEPERLLVDYQVGLSELTLIQDLRQIAGELPGADRRGWFEEYGRLLGPLNARGVLVTVNGEEVELRSIGFDLTIESHPLFTFHFDARIAPGGRLTLNDTNYLASEGTSRLALRSGAGVQVSGDDLPSDVTRIPIKPIWQLDKFEERRTRTLSVDFRLNSRTQPTLPIPNEIRSRSASTPDQTLSRLLDRDVKQAWPLLWLAAFVIGAAHAIQPGHGKMLVLASSMGQAARPGRGALLGLATALVHMTSVALIAGLLGVTRGFRPEEIHLTLAHLTGFLIAALGLWKLGRHLAGYTVHEDRANADPTSRGIIPLALAGGAVPCWDAVALVLVAEAIGRLRLGVLLLGAFSLGMASVLMLVGASASRFRAFLAGSERELIWERGLGITGGLILALIGVALLATG